ncbi:alpha/beta fold hydrolase [Pseudarthrobacter sp. NIBRBAC000502772]|uniref:alpha/beta fold hydrolase n=1 Tax=Pseudarthrobacter sp. NIBRBAC000502772 TaxID=2590775 RepID=UPI001FEE9E56|nr:alpha/beta fold hydrolase [Pseudarthrobacter sp. NIBRBAC000502772]
MSGRHTGEMHSHTVEGTDPQLFVEVHDPQNDAGLRPVLLLHGFSSSSKLNWHDTGWVAALLEAGRRVITVDLPGHGRSGAPEDMDSYSPSRIRADLLQIAFDAGVRPLHDGDPTSGVDVVGYSLGARLAWEFGATQPEIVHRLVLGGPNIADPLAAFDLIAAQNYLADGTPSRTSPRPACSRWPCSCRATTSSRCCPWWMPSRPSPSIPPKPYPTCRCSLWPATRTNVRPPCRSLPHSESGQDPWLNS